MDTFDRDIALSTSKVFLSLEANLKNCGDLREGKGLDIVSRRAARASSDLKDTDPQMSRILQGFSEEAEKIRIQIALNHFEVDDTYDLPASFLKEKSADIVSQLSELNALCEKVVALHHIAFARYEVSESYSPKVGAMLTPRPLVVEDNKRVELALRF